MDCGVHLEEPDVLDTTWTETVYDATSGAVLDPQMVQGARREEITYCKEIDVYDIVPVAECWSRTGKAPIPAVGWTPTRATRRTCSSEADSWRKKLARRPL